MGSIRYRFDSRNIGKGQSSSRPGRPDARRASRVNSRSEIARAPGRALQPRTSVAPPPAGARGEGSVPEAQGNADAVAFASMPPIAPADGPVLITGASGYIGSWAVYAFVRRGYTVQ